MLIAYFSDKELVKSAIVWAEAGAEMMEITCKSKHPAIWYSFDSGKLISNETQLVLEHITNKHKGYYICKTKSDEGFIIYSEVQVIVMG